MSIRVLQLGLDSVEVFGSVETIKLLLYSLSSTQRLEVLDISGCAAVTQAVAVDLLKSLGQTLRCLKVHGNQDVAGVCERHVYSTADLEHLGQTMKCLEIFRFDINYNGNWVRDLFYISAEKYKTIMTKLGTGPISDQLQRRLMEEIHERAENGFNTYRNPRSCCCMLLSCQPAIGRQEFQSGSDHEKGHRCLSVPNGRFHT